ncbi:S46 family peptidase, partial [bacterium]
MHRRPRPPFALSTTVLFASLAPLVALATASCGGEPKPPATPAPAPLAKADPADTSTADAGARASFQNPGGMWMPEQLAAQADTLKGLGLEVDPAALASPSSDVLQAVVSLGGCSASFVSPDGLIATNHHCSIGALQYNSTPADNLLENGYVAKTRADEKWNGPTARVFVTTALSDVTAQVRDGIDAIADDGARFRKMEER